MIETCYKCGKEVEEKNLRFCLIVDTHKENMMLNNYKLCKSCLNDIEKYIMDSSDNYVDRLTTDD